MGDDDEREAWPIAQVVGKPGDHFDIEVVGGFVEQQQIGVCDEGPRELDSSPLTTGEVAEGAAEGGLVEAAEETVKDLADARLGGPLVDVKAGHHVVRDGYRRVELLGLGDRRDMDIGTERHAPGVGRLESGHDGEQRALARAIAPNDRDALALANAK